MTDIIIALILLTMLVVTIYCLQYVISLRTAKVAAKSVDKLDAYVASALIGFLPSKEEHEANIKVVDDYLK